MRSSHLEVPGSHLAAGDVPAAHAPHSGGGAGARTGTGRRSLGLGCTAAPQAPPAPRVGIPPPEEPMATLRRRCARGEIGMAEFEARLDGPPCNEPGESMPWWNQ